MRKRGNGEGSVWLRKDGRWEGAVSYIDELGNSRRRRMYGATRREVLAKLKAAQNRVEVGAPIRDATATVSELIESWIANALEASDRKQSTKENYATIARTHLSPPPFGIIRLDRLVASDVEALLLRKRREGKSASTRRTIYTVLRAALDVAVRDKLLAASPAAAITRPAAERKDAAFLSRDDAERLLRTAAEDRLLALYVLMLGTGLRRGEALALRWSHVNLDGGALRVAFTLNRLKAGLAFTEPKTEKSRRTVPMPPPVVVALRAHKARQIEERLRLGLGRAPDDGLVFCTELGTPLEPRNVARRFEAITKAAELPGVTLHTLRHSAASLLIRTGAHLKVVQELFGHSSSSITGDIYAHVEADQHREAVDRLGDALTW